jgi:choline dehydrogenase-like flavoprotein
VRDLYVFDGSAFPTASGVNPQISIQAVAHMGARGLAARLT